MTIMFGNSRYIFCALLLSIAAIACIQPGAAGFSWSTSTNLTVYIDSSVQNMPAGSGGAGTAPADQVQAAATIWNNFFSTNEGNTTNFTISVVSSASQANVIVNAADLSATEPNAGAPLSLIILGK